MQELSPLDPGTEEAEEPPHRTLRRAAYLTSGVGMAHAILFLLAFYLASRVPSVHSSDQTLVDYYQDSNKRAPILIGLYLMPFAGIAFIWFIVALRMWISSSARRINVLLSNIQLVSGIVFIGTFFAAGAASSVTAAVAQFSDAQIDPITAREFPLFGSTILFVFGMRMAAMFVFATSNIGRRSGILPRWFTIVGFVVGLFLLLSVSFERALVVVFPLWIIGLCVILFLRARQIPADIVLPARGPIGPIVRQVIDE
jgi:hypothetical protein